MHRRTLTDRGIKSLRPAKPGQRYCAWDRDAPGLAVRVTDKGHKTFGLVARFPGSTNPTFRAIAEVGVITLAQARETARAWRAQIKAGVDPKIAEARKRQAEEAVAGNVFGLVAEQFIARTLPMQRRGRIVERILRKDVLPYWKHRPIGDIGHRDVREIVDQVVERGARAVAHNVFDAIRAVFNFAVERGILDVSPCAALKPSKLIGVKPIRTRVLDDNELRALWHAAGEVGYPFGPMVRALALTGARLTEAAGARWREFDLDKRVWVVPPERFKSGVQHTVPLSDQMMVLLATLPRWTRGDHLFSATFGMKAVSGFSSAKAQIDERMGALPAWVFHDVRRSVRTRLSELRVPDHIAELCIGHARKGLARIYDQHQYADELREAFNAWGRKLHSIVEPPPDNIVAMHKAATP